MTDTTTKQEITASVDWLRYTMTYEGFEDDTKNALAFAIPQSDMHSLTGESLPNARGYDSCMSLGIGRVHWHSERPEQLISCEFSGQDCGAMYARGFDWAGLWSHIVRREGWITTIHLAIDVKGYGADHAELEDALQAGKATTKARDVYTYAGGKIGKGRTEGTTYVGKPASERQLRCYNKGAERGSNEDWTRIELVIRGARAKRLAEALERATVPSVARATIAAFVKWQGCEWWDAALSGEIAHLSPVARKDTNTLEWLVSVVQPVLARELAAERERREGRLASIFAKTIAPYAGHQSE